MDSLHEIFARPSSFPFVAHAGEWARISSGTIAFSGEITKDDVAGFEKVYRPTDTTLTLNSTGGLNEPALAIAGTLIKNKNLTTVVHGICASSCANYLFLSGRTRKIESGVVGFHGSLRAYLESDRFKTELGQIDPKVAAERLPKLKQTATEEDAFFAAADVPADLFNRTQGENDMGLYDIYVPGPNAFAKYGVRNVIGVQDPDLMNKLIKDDRINILYDNSPASGPSDPSTAATR